MTIEKPILFSGPMVRAILEGRKTVTRRALPTPIGSYYQDDDGRWFDAWEYGREPCGAATGEAEKPIKYDLLPGDHLWVREALYRAHPDVVGYSADGEWHPDANWVWPRDSLRAMYCPRGLSRITLEVTGVTVERLQDITEEGADREAFGGEFPHRVMPELFPDGELSGNLSIPECFARLWDSINAKRPGGAWDDNPWVAAISFKRLGT
jgi:hypothetical protein